MAGASGIRAGRAFVELFADDRALVRGLRSAQQKLAAFGAAVRGLGTQMLALGAGIVAPLALAAKAFADTGSQLNDMAARTGVSVEALGELGYAAQQSGASLEDVEKAVRTMQRTIVAATNGSDQAAQALDRVGLSAEALAGLKPEQQFAAIAAALARIEDPTQRAASAMGVLGKSGTTLLPMVADLAALRAEARRLGVVMSDGQAKLADDLGDAFDRVKASLQGVAIKNAVESLATSPIQLTPGSVRILARQDDDLAVIQVTDTGMGLNAEELDEVRKFVPGKTSKKSHGTGFGLPIAWRKIHDHGGSLAIDSRPDAGTTVTLALPTQSGTSEDE